MGHRDRDRTHQAGNDRDFLWFLIVVFGLKNTTLIPYVLYLAKNVQNKNERDKMYGILESYIMRRIVVYASTKNYNNLFTSLILNGILDSDALLSRLKNGGDATTYDALDKDEWNEQEIEARASWLYEHAKSILAL